MRRVLTGMAAIALTCAASTMAMAQTTTPSSGPTTTNQTTTTQPVTTQPMTTQPMTTQPASTQPASGNDPNAMNAGMGAPTTENLNAPGMVPVHPANWQYDVMARQYHWNSPPKSANQQQ